tara:strand:+ start:3026 stop:3298 length:273 start_codon:yes stop_codon:yes gene_type:complete
MTKITKPKVTGTGSNKAVRSNRTLRRKNRRKKAIEIVGRQVVGINQAGNAIVKKALKRATPIVKKAAGVGLLGKKKKKSPGKKGPGGKRY